MRKTLFLLFALAVLCASVVAQSGRKSAPASKPPMTSTPAADDDPYSESKPTEGATYSRKKSEAKPAPIQPKPDATVTDTSGDETIKVSTDLVSIPVSVYERSGVYVGGLRRSDFKIFENGKEQEIAYFGTTEVPFSAVLLIDVSGSTDNKIKMIQSAALSFIDKLGPTDKVMVMEFDDSVRELCDFTSDRATLEKAIHKVGAGGGTALYHAVETVLKTKFKGIEGRKSLILFTDGVECSLRGGNGYENTLALAEESDAVIYSAYYNTYFDSRGIGGSDGPMSGMPTIKPPSNSLCDNTEDYSRGRVYLEELSRLTGGKMFRAEATTGGLSAAFEGIASELGNQYTIGYYSSEQGRTGERKQIKVRVNRPNMAVKARDFYIAGQAAQKPPTASK